MPGPVYAHPPVYNSAKPVVEKDLAARIESFGNALASFYTNVSDVYNRVKYSPDYRAPSRDTTPPRTTVAPYFDSIGSTNASANVSSFGSFQNIALIGAIALVVAIVARS